MDCIFQIRVSGLATKVELISSPEKAHWIVTKARKTNKDFAIVAEQLKHPDNAFGVKLTPSAKQSSVAEVLRRSYQSRAKAI